MSVLERHLSRNRGVGDELGNEKPLRGVEKPGWKFAEGPFFKADAASRIRAVVGCNGIWACLCTRCQWGSPADAFLICMSCPKIWEERLWGCLSGTLFWSYIILKVVCDVHELTSQLLTCMQRAKASETQQPPHFLDLIPKSNFSPGRQRYLSCLCAWHASNSDISSKKTANYNIFRLSKRKLCLAGCCLNIIVVMRGAILLSEANSLETLSPILSSPEQP